MTEIVEINGIGPTLATACAEAGFTRVDDIAGAAPAELAVVPGIGEARALILISAARSLLNGAQDPMAEDTTRMKPKKSKKQAKAKAKKSKKEKKKNNKKSGKGKKKKMKKKSKSGKKK